jgi:DUF4097 and DUF4098 domain-containing protein YvlB
VTINGSYSGETTLRKIAKPVRFMSNVTEMRMEKVPGEMTLGLSTLTGTNLTGPVFLKTQTKDIRLTDVTDSLTIDGQNGDVEVNQTKLPVPRIDVHTHSGDIELALPAGPKCTLNASTNHGGITNDFEDERLKQSVNDRGGKLTGALGGSTEVKLATERGDITVRKSVAGAPAPPAPPASPKSPAKAPRAPKAPLAPPEKVVN